MEMANTEPLSDTDLPAMEALKPATSHISISLHEPVKLRIGKHGSAAEPPRAIPPYFRECCQKYAQLPAFVYKTTTDHSAASSEPEDGKTTWVTRTFAEYEQHVQQTALMFLHVGLQPRSSVGILAFNCPEWFYAEFGALSAGGVVAGIYPSNSAEAVFHVLDTSGASVCIVDDANQMAKVRAIKSRLPHLRAILQLHGPFEDFVGVDEGYYRWEDLACMQFGDELREELQQRQHDLGANECALLIYTSGTVGMPKGVMLSHDSIIINSKAISNSLHDIVPGEESCVTYLPLSHIAAQLFDIFLMMENGGCVYIADHDALKGTLSRTMVKVKPTRFFGVPRIFEKMQEKLMSLHANTSFVTRYLFKKCRDIMETYYLSKPRGKSLKQWLATKVLQQIQISMGLDHCKTLLIGGAPATEDLKRFFLSLDMPLTDVYGLSEAGGVITLNFEPHRIDSVGKVLDGQEVKINNPDKNGHGEICIRSRCCFMGYLHDMAKTKEAMTDDDWLLSGDVGYFDSDGSLIMSGRIKELVITAGGENIPPVHIEELVKRELPGISNAVLVGDRRKYLTILLTLKTDIDAKTNIPLDALQIEVKEWLRSLDLPYERLSEVLNIPADLSDADAANVSVVAPPKLLQSIEEGIQRANTQSISNAQKVQKFSILPHDLSVATGELGPTLKMRRNVILQKYASTIERMYT